MPKAKSYTPVEMSRLGFTADDPAMWTNFPDGTPGGKLGMLSVTLTVSLVPQGTKQVTVYADGGMAWYYDAPNEPDHKMRWYRYPTSTEEQVRKWLESLTGSDLDHFRRTREK